MARARAQPRRTNGIRIQIDLTFYGSPLAIRRAAARVRDKTYVDKLEAAIARRLLRK